MKARRDMRQTANGRRQAGRGTRSAGRGRRQATSGTRLAALLTGALLGCRGDISAEPPVHLNQNMDFQARFDAQEANEFFADGRAMRLPPQGTVAQDELRDDTHRYSGKVNGTFASTLPMPITAQLLARGRDRFDIYCAPCHDSAGTGQGVVAKRGQKFGMMPLPDFRHERIVSMPAGQIYDVIANGARGMPPYGAQLAVDDRWAIVAYVRAIQVSGRARLADLPAEVREQLGFAAAVATPTAEPAAPAPTPAQPGAK